MQSPLWNPLNKTDYTAIIRNGAQQLRLLALRLGAGIRLLYEIGVREETQ